MMTQADPDRLAAALLEWYDSHARSLPWRVSPADRAAGRRPDPYRVWLSEIMLQQTTVAVVGPYFEAFVDRWPRVEDLAAADPAEVRAAWAGLGYYARARNMHRCAGVVTSEYGGVFPDTRSALQELPGIGPYTSAAIAAIAFDRPETVVDGNVERVMARLHAIRTPLPAAKKDITAFASALTPSTRPGDYAQALMDLGATVCLPRAPACGICPWREACDARTQGIQEALPAKAPRKPRPVRVGHVFVVRDEGGAWALEQRPETGLLGGMRGFPGSTWEEIDPESVGGVPSAPPAPPCAAAWHACGEVRHTFTHFHLRLHVWTARVTARDWLPQWIRIPAREFRVSDLPGVMRKVARAAATPDQSAATSPVVTDSGAGAGRSKSGMIS